MDWFVYSPSTRSWPEDVIQRHQDLIIALAVEHDRLIKIRDLTLYYESFAAV